MEKTIIFIDAGFLSKLSKHLGKGNYIKFNIIKFSKIVSEKENLIPKQIFYYTAPPFQSSIPTEDEKRRKENYDKFINKLSKNEEIIIREGRVQKIIEDNNIKYTQKGVDTLLTMDLMSIPLNYPEIKTIILIACDSDFVPVIKKLISININVILLTYFDRKRNSNFSSSNELIQTVSKFRQITKEDFENSKI